MGNNKNPDGTPVSNAIQLPTEVCEFKAGDLVHLKGNSDVVFVLCVKGTSNYNDVYFTPINNEVPVWLCLYSSGMIKCASVDYSTSEMKIFPEIALQKV